MDNLPHFSTIVVDGDILAYEIGFAAQANNELVAPDLVEVMLINRITQIIDGVGQPSSVIIALTEPPIHRTQLATILPYKGNRKSEKPHYWQFIRDSLKVMFPYEVWEGMEADDIMTAIQSKPEEWGYAPEIVVASRDKDLLQSPGFHYRWNIGVDHNDPDADRGELKEVSELEGHRNLWLQMITGDSADNILGIHGLGPKSSVYRQVGMSLDPEEMALIVADLYYKHYRQLWWHFYQENLNLLYLLRSRSDSAIQYLERIVGESTYEKVFGPSNFTQTPIWVQIKERR